MDIITDIRKIKLNNTCITIGKFDGMHLGHRKLFSEMNKRASLKKVFITFDRAPMEILTGNPGGYLLNTSEKQSMCARYGIDVYVCIPVTREFLNMTAEKFISCIVAGKLGAKCIVTGDDFRFGKDRLGNAAMILKLAEKYGYDAVSVPREIYKGIDISSTRIKEAIKNGQIEDANNMLGYSYTIKGRIEHGRQIGSRMGLPTANIIPEAGKILPPKGVYKTIVITEDGKHLEAVSNIGINPTVSDNKDIKFESHILDFNEKIYGTYVEVRLMKFVRPEKKFNSIEELKNQINADIQICKSL